MVLLTVARLSSLCIAHIVAKTTSQVNTERQHRVSRNYNASRESTDTKFHADDQAFDNNMISHAKVTTVAEVGPCRQIGELMRSRDFDSLFWHFAHPFETKTSEPVFTFLFPGRQSVIIALLKR